MQNSYNFFIVCNISFWQLDSMLDYFFETFSLFVYFTCEFASFFFIDKLIIDYQCMTSTQELVGIHNDSAHKSWSKYTTDVKVGKVN